MKSDTQPPTVEVSNRPMKPARVSSLRVSGLAHTHTFSQPRAYSLFRPDSDSGRWHLTPRLVSCPGHVFR
eukprot:1650849-Rhodomonas_salina.2